MRAILSLLVFLTVPAFGQSTLSPCNPNVAATSWTNCQGTETYANGDKYVGAFRDGKRHGRGTYYFLAENQFKGDKYVGELKSGKIHGQGTYTSADGQKYVGEHRDGERHGQGTSTWADGSKYVGEWRDGKPNGRGTYFFLAENQFKGHTYVGEFKDNKRDGQGIYTFSDGRPPLEGVWENENFVRAQRIPDHIAGRTNKQPDLRQQAAGSSVNQPAASPASKVDLARGKCGDLGLKPGTEKFGECVLRLSK